MTRSRDDLLVKASMRRHPIENLLVQFSVLSLVTMVILGVVLSVILTTRLDREFDLLKAQEAVIADDAPGSAAGLSHAELDTELNLLRWTVYVSVGGGFIILWVGLVWIVWGGWRTINNQQAVLLETNVDLRDAYQELRDAQERLVRSERLAAIGELSAGVAHDLRNPLGAIKNAAYYLKGKVKDSDLAQNPRITEFLAIMEEEVETSNEILMDLMEFARVNPPNRFPIRLQTVVDGALARTPMKENVKVETHFWPSLPQLLADGEQLRRVFGNLIKNADDAMPEGGTLTISGKTLDGFVELQFADTGEGISTPDLGRVMDPLFTTKAKGIGLGLSIVNMIVERHDGNLGVTSKEGEGTTITVRLPFDSDEENKQDLSDGSQEAESLDS